MSASSRRSQTPTGFPKFTHPSDKLIALAALAENHNRTMNDIYIVGLWSSSLPSGLLWSVLRKPSKRRPPGYRAPSWSWACLDDRIEPHFNLPSSRRKDRLQILEQNIQLTSPKALYGSVTSTHLVVKGRIQHAQLMARHQRCLAPSLGLQHPDFEGKAATIKATTNLDALDDALTTDHDGFISVVFLEVGPTDPDYHKSVEGLILLPRGDSCFSRLGVFTVGPSELLTKRWREKYGDYYHDLSRKHPELLGHVGDWFSGSESCTITLI